MGRRWHSPVLQLLVVGLLVAATNPIDGNCSPCDPKHMRVRSYPVRIEPGETLAKGPYVAETFPVTVEESYVLIEV